ncbi:DUF3791 domain-containing protein [Phocaeicola sp.]
MEKMISILPFTEVEIRTSFAASCIEMAAHRLGCSYQEVYKRMKRVGLIQAYLKQLDPLHTQSREYVTDEVVNTLLRLEKEIKEGGKQC